MPAKTFTDNPPLLTPWRVIAVGFIAGCAASFNMGKISAALPVLSEDLGLSLLAGSSLVALFSIVIACCGFFAGFLGSVAGAGRTVQAGLFACGVGSIAGAFADSMPWLQLGRIVEGIGWLLIAVAVPAIFGAVAAQRDRPLVLGVWGAFVPAGMVLALLVSPIIMAATDWRMLWIFSGTFSLIWLLVVRYTLAGISLPVGPLLSPRLLFASVSTSAPWLMACCFMVYSAQFIILTAFLPTLLLERYSITLADAAALGAAVIVANGIGNVIAGVLIKAGVNFARVLTVAAVLMGLCSAFVFSGKGELGLVVVAAFIALGVGGTIPGSLFAAAPRMSCDPRFVACTVGLMLQFAGIGQLLGPISLGRVVDRTESWAGVAGLNLLLAIVGIIGSLLLYRKTPEVR